MTTPNGQLLLVSGESATGKSASLKDIKNQDRWLYMNTESGKALPFKNNFVAKSVTDPYQLDEAFNVLATNAAFDGMVIDSLTFLMDMYESKFIIGAKDGREAWGQFAQYFKNMMQQWVVTATEAGKHVIFLAHTRTEQDAQLIDRVAVPIKGSLKNNGIESYFSTVVSTKKVDLKQLEPYASDLLNITEDDRLVGYKHVFQTRLTKETVGERVRGPMGLFTQQQTFVDNNLAMLLEHMIDYYA